MPRLKPNESAPEFSLPADTGSPISLTSLKGRRVVLYFYPKDDTPGCTKQACEFRDLAGQFDRRNTVVLGISGDDLKSHELFKRKNKLNFPLLTDEDYKVHKLYGAWGEITRPTGKKMGVVRTTVVIDDQGKVLYWEKGVNPVGNASKVLQLLL
ncbi:MAG: peroxiredoxin [Deltaproteobacteria bacterium]|nr:peroxiredoxin [Deltaproteobacteria bacterium]